MCARPIDPRLGRVPINSDLRKPQTQWTTVPCTVLYTIEGAVMGRRYAHIDQNGIKGNVLCCDEVTEGPAVLVIVPAVNEQGRWFGRAYCRPVGFTWED